MKPAKLDLAIYKGDTFQVFGRIRERVLDGGVYVDGEYVDLTDWVGLAQIRSAATAPEVAAVITVEIANQTTARGGFFLRMTPAQTAAIELASGKYDLQFTLPDDNVHTFLFGDVTMTDDVSKVVP